MPTKDRLLEFQKQPVETDITNELERQTVDNTEPDTEGKNEEHSCHLIGSGGKLADFFEDVENISGAIEGVQKSIDEVKIKQLEILSTPGNQKLQEQLEDIKADIKQRINSKIRAKVTFHIIYFSK